jgi:hypothetical protein
VGRGCTEGTLGRIPHIVKDELDAESIEALVARIKQLHTGLLPEDEFATLVCWLGNCAGIHRIGQAPMPLPDVPDKMRAPEFIAFPIVGGKPFPVLIEVKSCRQTAIKWSEKYLLSPTIRQLREFASAYCVEIRRTLVSSRLPPFHQE